MKSIMYDLYYGNLVAWERGRAQNPDYKPITKKISDIDEHFQNLLSPEEYKKFEEMQDLRADIGSIEDVDLFEYALCMGILLMIDVFSFKEKRLTESDSE